MRKIKSKSTSRTFGMILNGRKWEITNRANILISSFWGCHYHGNQAEKRQTEDGQSADTFVFLA